MNGKKIFLVVLMLTMLFTLVLFANGGSEKPSASAGGESVNMIGNMYKTGYPIVKEKMTITVMVQRTAWHKKPFNELQFVKDYETLTNVHVEWTEIAESAWEEKKNLMLVSGDLTDVIFRGLTVNDEMTYGTQGILLPLNDLIENWAPGINGIFNKNPEIRSFVTTPDGNIYALPKFSQLGIGDNPDNMFINQVWLDKLGLKMPETTEEFYNVMKAFKEKDPNGNGKKDEVPFSFIYGGWPGVNYYSLFGAFGRLDNVNHIVGENGKAVFTADKDEYKNAIKYLSRLYSEGLLDIEIFTQKEAQMKAKGTGTDNLLGSFIGFWRTTALNPDRGVNYSIVPPLKGPKGDRSWNFYQGADIKRGGFAITALNKNPEIAMRWIDAISDQDISMSAMYGPKGYGWNENADGSLTLLSPAGVSFDEHKHSESLGNSAVLMILRSTLDKIKYAPGDPTKEKLVDAAIYQPFYPKEVMPSMYFPKADQDELAILNADILEYVKKMSAEWIVNGKIDSEWNGYIDRLKSMGLEKYVGIYDKAYKAYLSN